MTYMTNRQRRYETKDWATPRQFKDVGYTSKAAQLSDCGTYRWTLLRRWGHGPCLVWLMLNPSTADAEKDDPTIRRVVGFSSDAGYGSALVMNLFPFRATEPKDLKTWIETSEDAGDIISHNLLRLRAAFSRKDVVMAFGVHAWPLRRDTVFAACNIASAVSAGLFAVGTTAEGWPRHPLYSPKGRPRKWEFPDRFRKEMEECQLK